MRPIKFTKQGSYTIFHYPFSFLREFITLGRKEGNTGMILIGRSNNLLHYKGFGTIENSRVQMFSLHIQHWEVMDGPMPSDEDRVKEKKEEFPFKYAGVFIPAPKKHG